LKLEDEKEMEPIDRRFLTYECKKDNNSISWRFGWITKELKLGNGTTIIMRMRRV